MKQSYGVLKQSEKKFKIVNFQRKATYFVERKPKTFKKSGKTYIIWQCSCPSYQKWAWKSHECKHIRLLIDIKEII